MNFRPELAAKVMSGEKTVTRRLVRDNPRSPWYRERCSLEPDRFYAVCPGRGKQAIGRVRVVKVARERLGHVDAGEAGREGFASVVAFEEAFSGINGRYDPDALVWRIAFELDDDQPRLFAWPELPSRPIGQ